MKRFLAVLTALILLTAAAGLAEQEAWWKETIAYEIYNQLLHGTGGV